MRGREIVLAAEPKGRFEEGTAVGTLYPGMCVEVDPTKEMTDDGRFFYRVATPGGNGQRTPIKIVCPDHLQGKTASDSIADGERLFLYSPINDEDMNIMVADSTGGTGDSYSIGDKLMIENGTGMFMPTASTPEAEPFVIMENIEGIAADQLVWCKYVG